MMNTVVERSKKLEEKLTPMCWAELRIDNPVQDINKIINEKGDWPDANSTWVKLNKHYEAWLMTSSPGILWVSGGPGKGKTEVSSFLAESLSRMTREKKHGRFIYFFCNDGNDKQNSALTILRSLILQLLAEEPGLLHWVLPAYDTRVEYTLRNVRFLWLVFEQMVLCLAGVTYCMVGRLNECIPGSQRFLVNMLKETEHFKRTSGTLKLILTGTETNALKDLSEHMFTNNPSCLQRLNLDSPNE